jgi:hypothetical protein
MTGERATFISYGGPERRERILAERRRRYQEDADYREAVKQRAKAGYKPSSGPKGKRKPRGRNKPKPYLLPDGALTVLIGLGQLADECGVSKQAIRRYEDRSVIPRNFTRDHRNRRWYLRDFADFLVPLLQGQARRRELLRSLAVRVEQAWQTAVRSGTVHILPREYENVRRHEEGDCCGNDGPG